MNIFAIPSVYACKRTATCRECGKPILSGTEGRRYGATRGTLIFTHEKCVKSYGKPIGNINDNGGSVNQISVVVKYDKPADKATLTKWSYFLRTCGYTVEKGGIARGTIPAQCVAKALRTVGEKSTISINGGEFVDVDTALKQIKAVTNGNSHAELKTARKVRK